ncbi:exodeoxyribonuclease V subunit gamma [Halomonas binhaiensis]|uniref:RecBCD enzyme subunit RecC n=1 Tax=Halomonas binhaiensis TaxID=2562282 RepID=A0A5C1NL64_9GAMM|nr:exodeoxyribonuclease V subunit gamma [Halomonas binhaiensis]QEM83118.1 exodeoxyribonuclease V subunit gamma [Halomonas binhaiensis]
MAQSTALTPGFMVIHGNHLEALRDLAVNWMRQHPLGPLENEVLLVQSNGISQWLKLALAANPEDGGCGIAAALDVTLPARFLWQAYRTVLTHLDGPDSVPSTSPFDKSRLTWRLMRLLPSLLDAPDTAEAFTPLKRFLDTDDDQRKRHQLAERLADLFDQYQVYRGDWLEAWSNGDDVLIDARGQSRPLPQDQHWQAVLWRVLRADIGEAGIASSRAGVHQRFVAACQSLDDSTRPAGLPRRIMVFGISSLPSQTLEALAALSRMCQVVLCVHNPCEFYWADIIEHRDLLRAARRRQQQRPGMPLDLDDSQMHLHAHPLLAAWGKQGRDYLRLLDEFDEHQQYAKLFENDALRIDLFEPHALPDGRQQLLHQLQDDIRALRPLSETQSLWPAVEKEKDVSLTFHIAHSPLREVEILHDQLLAAFSADETLRPRDVLVMVPEVDAYAAAVTSVFGRLESDDPRYIPFTLSDQASRHRQPLAIAVETLTRLPELRLSVSNLLDLLEVPAVRERFAIREDDLPVLERWIAGSGIRWGLDAEQRQSLDLPGGLSQNTWTFGLRRLLLGYAVGEGAADEPTPAPGQDTAWHDIAPYGDIGGLEAALAGPLVRLIDTLEHHWHALSTPTDVGNWCIRLRALLDDCLSPVDDNDSNLLSRLDLALETWHESAIEADFDGEIPLAVVREQWLTTLDDGGLSQRFLAGAVNVATLMPMRAIPFRHVWLLGMNDGDYPRTQIPQDFDLMGQDYRPGDRSRREDDRYLFLEALLSARERLSISWVGRSIHDNSECPPSVLVSQLRDHLARGWQLDESDENGSTALLEHLTTEHPLTPFSPHYFMGQPHLFSYAHEWRQVHDRDALTDQVIAPLPAWEANAPLTLARLSRLLDDPVATFFNQRLGVRLALPESGRLDQEPFALNGLDRWQLQDTLIQAQRRAVDSTEGGEDDRHQARQDALYSTLDRLAREGHLAMGGFAERMRQHLVEPMDELFELYARTCQRWPHAHQVATPVSLTLGGLEIEDVIDELRQDADGQRCRVVLLTSSLIRNNRYHWKHWVRPWVVHLVAQICLGPTTTRLLSRVGDGHLPPLSADEAQSWLGNIATVWHQAMCRPLPLARDSAFAWLRKGGTPAAMSRILEGQSEKADEAALDDAWKVLVGNEFQPGEFPRNAYLTRVWAGPEALINEHGNEFAALAESLYGPLSRLARSGEADNGGNQ